METRKIMSISTRKFQGGGEFKRTIMLTKKYHKYRHISNVKFSIKIAGAQTYYYS